MAPAPASPKRTRTRTSPWAALHEPRTSARVRAAQPLSRPHAASYHRPYLLDAPDVARQLLAWFDRKQHDRDMPWRQPWIDPKDDVPHTHMRAGENAAAAAAPACSSRMQRRAYEVWISEIMLQQTRVETVRSYWMRWVAKWPTLEALADASVDDVLAAWRGLGYYGRARRIHEAAQKVMQDPQLKGHLPAHAHELVEHIPGVGPYTAGAISSIVFGYAVPILDGNVARVLTRQTGLYADPRAKSTTDLLWHMARMLVESVATHERSDVPGRWNQGLMELGSTVCTPTRPACETCPIQSTCVAHAESALYERPRTDCVQDVEDLCRWCAPIPDPADDASDEAPKPAPKKLKQTTLFGSAPKAQSTARESQRAKYTQLFPMRIAKQAPRQETRLVCIVRATRYDGKDLRTPLYALAQRPDDGLLAKLWEFPTKTLDAEEPGDAEAAAFVTSLRLPPPPDGAASCKDVALHATRTQCLGRVRHEFSHLHWHMHVVVVDVDVHSMSGDDDDSTASPPQPPAPPRVVWESAGGVEAASMGTGLRRCWSLLVGEN